MSDQANSNNTRNAISSPVSVGGHTPCASPDGRMIGPCGPDRAHANLSARLAKALGLMTKGTYGPSSDGSSISADLQSSLANRLHQKMDVNGSPEYVLTWKEWPIASGPPICALRARARPISDNACGGWPTPMAQNPKGGNCDYSRKVEMFMGQRETVNGPKNLAGWSTPRANKWGFPDAHGSKEGPLIAKTANNGALNPAHSRWLMGYPIEWDYCGATVTLSTRKRQKRS